MFTIGAFLAIALLAWWAQRANKQERDHVSRGFDDDLIRQSIVFIREDVKLIALGLAAILVMLGIIADKLK